MYQHHMYTVISFFPHVFLCACQWAIIWRDTIKPKLVKCRFYLVNLISWILLWHQCEWMCTENRHTFASQIAVSLQGFRRNSGFCEIGSFSELTNYAARKKASFVHSNMVHNLAIMLNYTESCYMLYIREKKLYNTFLQAGFIFGNFSVSNTCVHLKHSGNKYRWGWGGWGILKGTGGEWNVEDRRREISKEGKEGEEDEDWGKKEGEDKRGWDRTGWEAVDKSQCDQSITLTSNAGLASILTG